MPESPEQQPGRQTGQQPPTPPVTRPGPPGVPPDPPTAVPAPPGPPGPPAPAAGHSLKPVAVAAGVATVALAGGIAAVALTSGSSQAADGSVGPEQTIGSGQGRSGTGSPTTDGTGGSAAGTTGTTPGGTRTGSELSIAGDWTGTIDGGGTPVGMRLTLDDADPAAVTGKMMFADPETKAWAPAGALTGNLDGATLHLESSSDAVLTLAVAGNSMTGTGELTRKDNPFPIRVTLARG